MKRSSDFLLSLTGLIVFAPVFLFVSLIIWLTDRGHIFYLAPRTGLNGKTFRMYKFRTMVVGADKIGAASTTVDDKRITPVGHFLRKYKLDELPQLINVLIGNMSLVGPRPDVKFFTDLFTEEEKMILTVKPGITDWASLWNIDEGAILQGSDDPDRTYMEQIWPEKKRLQLKYVRERNFLTDLKILALTIIGTFTRKIGSPEP